MDENFVGVNLIFVTVRLDTERVRQVTKSTKNSNRCLNETDSGLEKQKLDHLVMKQRSFKHAWQNSNSCLNGSIKNLFAFSKKENAMNTKKVYIGVDVSKKKLDMDQYGRFISFENNLEGFDKGLIILNKTELGYISFASQQEAMSESSYT